MSADRKSRAGVFRRIGMAAGVGGSAHAVEEDAGRRCLPQVEPAAVQEPFLEGRVEAGEGRTQRLNPGVVFVDDVNLAQEASPGKGAISPSGKIILVLAQDVG